MGRATRWLKSLLGKKEGASTRKDVDQTPDAAPREKKRWSFTKPTKDGDPGAVHGGAAAVDSAWLRNYYAHRDKEQSKHAIAVAAATAAAADAAVAAAQAAVEVVRLTSQGTGGMFSVSGGGGAADGQRWAAVKIQTTFRAYLAKKALRALKALVKLQALVRGYLVRKQAAATLHSMQALIRAQAAVRMQRSSRATRMHNADLMLRPRRSLERFDETRSEHVASSFHSRRLSATLDHSTFAGSDIDSPKIVEVDPGRPKTSASATYRTRRAGGLPASSDSTTTDSTMTPPPSHSSPLLQPPSARLIIPASGAGSHDPDWCLTGDECRFSTAQCTPRFAVPFSGALPPTPAKSVCGGGGYYFHTHYHPGHHHVHHQGGSAHHPNYMANTQSFTAKVRSQSAPKQRPEPRVRVLQQHQRMSLSDAVADPRASLSGVRMQRNCSRAQEALSFKNAIAGRLVDRSADLAGSMGGGDIMPAYDRDNGYYYYSTSLQRRW